MTTPAQLNEFVARRPMLINLVKAVITGIQEEADEDSMSGAGLVVLDDWLIRVESLDAVEWRLLATAIMMRFYFEHKGNFPKMLDALTKLQRS